MAGPEDFNAAEVARKEFATGFRGFDQYEVRAYLARLAAEMGVLQERERGLRERLIEIERKRPSDRVLADEEIETALGVEATKVIHAAREAGAEIRARAEENVARLLREAQDEAQAMRTEASALLGARTEEAEAAGNQIVEAAQQRGREMVAEAQAVRERMLRDLARRRRHAETQIQLLLGGRERLVAALEQAVGAATGTTEQLQAVELSDLPPMEAAAPEAIPPSSPTEDEVETVPAPVENPAPPIRRMAAVEPEAESAPGGSEDRSRSESSAPSPAGGGARPGDERRAGSLRLLRRRGEAQAPALEDDVEGVRIIRPEPVPFDEVVPAEPVPVATDEAGAEVTDEPGEALAEPDPADPTGPDEALDGSPTAGSSEDEADTAGVATPVIELFARLRADRAAATAPSPTEAADGVTEPVVEGDTAAEAPAVDGVEPAAATDESQDQAVQDHAVEDLTALDAAFETRDAALEDAERALARSLKRALSDEQNEVLDSLRRLKGTPRIEVLLPEPEVHVGRYERVAAGPLATAATVGAAAVEVRALDVTSVARQVSVDELARRFADEVADDLRFRLERALDAGTSDAESLVEAISAGYREWKGARTDGIARHHTASAYSAAFYAAAPDAELRWMVDPAEGGCPDCDDNALAGPTPKGTPYPTGQLHPPAHVGCRCLLRPLA